MNKEHKEIFKIAGIDVKKGGKFFDIPLEEYNKEQLISIIHWLWNFWEEEAEKREETGRFIGELKSKIKN